MSALAERIRRSQGEPEDSRAIRVIVAVMVEVGVLAVVAQGAVDAATGAAALVLTPLGYTFSYVRRRRPSFATKLALVAGLLVVLGAFLRAVEGAGSFDDAREPLAALFLWVQVLHSFDVPRRRDLGFSVASSLILVAEAGALSFGTGFLLFLVPWSAVAGVYLFVTLDPGPVATDRVIEVRRPVDARTGRGAVAVARVVATWAVVAAVAISVVFLALPRLPGLDLALPPFRADRATAVQSFRGQVVNPGISIGADGVPRFSDLGYPGFSDSVDLRSRGLLSDEVVLRVRSPQAALWRGLAYDTYDGTRWTVSDDRVLSVPQTFESFDLSAPARGPLPVVRVLTTFYVRADLPNVVFGAYRPEEVFFPASQLTVDRYGSVRAPILLEDGVVYSVISQIPAATPALLRATSRIPLGVSDPALAPYLQLPAGLPERVAALAERITAGAPTTFDAVTAVESWLRRNTTYNLDVPADPPGTDAVDHFLFERREGFCEHIASAMAVLLRASGIPTRLVTGFGPGSRNPFTGYFDVRASDAHAWVEVYYPGAGWIPSDPTFGVPPADPGAGGRFIAPEVLAAVGRFLAAAVPEPVRRAATALGRAIASTAVAWPVLAAATGIAVLALLGIRRRRAARRAAGPPPVGVGRAFAELEGAMAARGHPRGDHQTPREFARSLRPYLPPVDRAHVELVVELFERDRYSGEPLGVQDVDRALAAAGRLATSSAAPASATATGPQSRTKR
ncbi:MAG: transglutaminase TgpA family protein [Actinomycetota bacterium]